MPLLFALLLLLLLLLLLSPNDYLNICVR